VTAAARCAEAGDEKMIAIRRLPRRARGFLVVAAAWAVTAVVGLVIAGTATASGPTSGVRPGILAACVTQ
jgi:hypothetical protein